jgi:hypothetical protein
VAGFVGHQVVRKAGSDKGQMRQVFAGRWKFMRQPLILLTKKAISPCSCCMAAMQNSAIVQVQRTAKFNSSEAVW